MAATEQKRIGVFVCTDLTGLLMVNAMIPAMIKLGYEPVLFDTGDKHNRRFVVPTPPVVSFFNTDLLRDVITPFAERQDGRGANLLTYRQLAEKHGLQYRPVHDVNEPGFLQTLNKDASLVGALSVRFLQVFEDEIIDLFRERGFMWNLHSGLLPDYKGLLLPYRAIDNGEKYYGVTLHETARKIDHGKVLDKHVLPLDRVRPVLDLYLDTVPGAAGIVDGALNQLTSTGTVQAAAQALKAGEYYTNPDAGEFRRLTADGIYYADAQTITPRLAHGFYRPGSKAHADLSRKLHAAIGVPAPESPRPNHKNIKALAHP